MKKIARQRKALERFHIMTIDEWAKVHKYKQYLDTGSLADVVVTVNYAAYCKSKLQEKEALIKSVT